MRSYAIRRTTNKTGTAVWLSRMSAGAAACASPQWNTELRNAERWSSDVAAKLVLEKQITQQNGFTYSVMPV